MGSGTQKLTSYTCIQSNLLHSPLIIYTVGAHTQPEHSSLSTTWSQPTALLSLPPQIPHTYLCPSQTGCKCLLHHAPASLTSMPSLKLLSEMPSSSISMSKLHLPTWLIPVHAFPMAFILGPITACTHSLFRAPWHLVSAAVWHLFHSLCCGHW